MSRSDQHTTARITRTNAEYRNGVLIYVPKRPTLDASAAIAEQTTLGTVERTEDGLRALSHFKVREAQAKRERAIETARQLRARDAARAAQRQATPVQRRIQMVADSRRYTASQGRLPHVGAHTAGKHTADLDAGMVNVPLHVMAKRRSA